MRNPAVRFALTFLVFLGVFSLLFQVSFIQQNVVVPLTTVSANISNVVLKLIGMRTEVNGTVISGEEGFSVNILNGCNGAYVTAILISAVLAFPSTFREKLYGLAMGIPGVQAVNLVRIVSLYYIGVRQLELFEKFHYYVWQTGVIILSMAIWILWAEVVVGRGARAPQRRQAT